MDNAFAIQTTADLQFSIENNCYSFNTIQGYGFNIMVGGNTNFNITTFNMTNYYGIQNFAKFITAEFSSEVAITLSDLNIDVETEFGGFTFMVANGSSPLISNTNFTLDGFYLTRAASTTQQVISSVFLLAYINNIVAQNINIDSFQYYQLSLIDSYEATFINVSNVNVVNSQCIVCSLILNENDTPASLYMTNIIFNSSLQFQLVELTGKMDLIHIINFTMIDSQLVEETLAEYSLHQDDGDLRNVTHENWYIKNSQMGSITFADCIQNEQLIIVPDFQIVFKNLSVFSTNFTDKNNLIQTEFFQIVILDSYFKDLYIFSAFMIATSSLPGNVLIGNTKFEGIYFNHGYMISNTQDTGYPQKWLFYKIVAMQGCVLKDLFVNGSQPLINNEVDYTVFYQNIISNVSGPSLEFISTTQQTAPSNFERNLEYEKRIFEKLPILNEIFDMILGPNSTYCNNMTCYFNFIAQNTFSEVNVNDIAHDSYLFMLNSLNQGIVEIFVNNTYINMINNMLLYYFPSLTNSTLISGDIISNVVSEQYFTNYIGSFQNVIGNLLFYGVNIEKIIAYENTTLVANYNLTISTSMEISNNIFYSSVFQTIMDLEIQYTDYIDISNNYIENCTMFVSQYNDIYAISLSVSNSIVDITLNFNTFSNLVLSNNITIQGFYPPQMNALIQAQLYTGANLLIQNSVFQNITLSALLSYFLNLQGESITIENVIVEDITLTNTNGYAILVISPDLVMNNVSFAQVSAVPNSDYLGDKGFILVSYVDIYFHSRNNVSFNGLIINDWDQGYFFTGRSATFNFDVKNSTFLDTNQVFLIHSGGGNYNFSDIYFTSGEGSFFTTSAQTSISSIISITNFNMTNALNSTSRGAFKIEWEEFSFIATDIFINNLGLLTTQGFKGNVLIQNIFLTGDIDHAFILAPDTGTTNIIVINMTLSDLFGDYLFEIVSQGNVFINISQVLISETTLNFGLYFTSPTDVNSNMHVSDVVAAASKISAFIVTNIGTGKATLSLVNSIFFSGAYSLIQNMNASLVISNLIHNAVRFEDTIYDVGILTTTSTFTNISVYNVSSSVPWLQLITKQATASSLVFSANTNGLGIVQSNMGLDESIFIGNLNAINKGAGGCIISVDSTVNINNTFAIYNVAPMGGFAYANISELSGGLVVENSYLKNNFAYYYGNQLASNAYNMQLSLLPLDIADGLFAEYYNTTLVTVQSGFQFCEYILHNASTTANVNLLFNMIFSDYYNQQISFGPPMILVNVSVYNPLSGISNVFLSGNKIQDVVNFPTSLITFPPANSSVNITFYIKLETEILTLNLTINSRGCMIGEVYDEVTGACELCPANYYSLNSSQQCQLCPFGAICPGGSFLNVSQNYWRNPGTSDIYSCFDDGVYRCMGGLNVSNQCATGFSGALCLGCDIAAGYSKSTGNTCIQCTGDSSYTWIKNVLIFLLGYAYQLIFIIIAYNSNYSFVVRVIHKNDEKNYYKSKIYEVAVQFFFFTNFLYIILLIVTYASYIETNLVVILDEIQFLIILSASSITQSSDFSCWVLSMGFSPQNLTYVRVVFTTIVPFFKIIVTAGTLLIVNFIKKVENLYTKISIIVISISLLDQNYILQILSQFSTCFNGELSGYSEMDPNISCTDPKFVSFVSSYVLPNIIFWGIGIPLIFAILLFIYRDRRREQRVRFNLGGLMNNFEDKLYYWGLVVLLVRQILLIIFTLIKDSKNATLFAIVLMGGYSYLTGRVKPYYIEQLNNIDKYCSFLIYVTLIMFNQAIGNSYELMTSIFVVGIFIIYAGIIGVLGFKAVTGFLIQFKTFKNRNKVFSVDSSMLDTSGSNLSLNDSFKKNSIEMQGRSSSSTSEILSTIKI